MEEAVSTKIPSKPSRCEGAVDADAYLVPKEGPSLVPAITVLLSPNHNEAMIIMGLLPNDAVA